LQSYFFKINTLAAFLLFLVMPNNLFSQTIKLSGHILNESRAVPFANVYIPELNIGVSADLEGRFKLDLPVKTNFTILVSAIGFKKFSKNLTSYEKDIVLKINLDFDVLALDQVVVSATRDLIKRKESPVIISVSDKQLIQSVQAISLSEGLSFQPGLRVENNCQNCGFSQVRINGLSGPYSQILIDSRPVFSALNGVYGLDQIPSNMVERIEVVRGGGSALYGANAIAGTINIITKDPIENAYEINHHRGFVAAKTFDNSTNANISWVAKDLKKGITIFGSNRSREAFDANGDGFSEITQLLSNAAGFKGFWKTGNQSRISVEYHYLDEFRRGGNLLNLKPEKTDITEQLNHYINGFHLSFEKYSKSLKHRFAIYSSTQLTKRLSYYGGGGNEIITEQMSPEEKIAAEISIENAKKYYGNTFDLSNASGIQYSGKFLILNKETILTSGIENAYNEVSDKMPGYFRKIDQKVNNTGVYGQIKSSISHKTTLLAGFRYDYNNLLGYYSFENIVQKTEKKLGVFNPRISLMYNFKENLQLRMGYATGFRSQQAFDEDLHIETLNGSAQFVKISTNLKPEKSHAYNASIDYSNKRFSLTLESFFTDLRNPFINVFTGDTLPQSGASVVEKRNSSGSIIYGLNIESKIIVNNNFDIQLGFTAQKANYKKAETIFENKNVQIKQFLRTPELYGFWACNYRLKNGFTIDLNGNYTGKMTISNERLQTLNSSQRFWEINSKISYDIDLGKKICLELYAGFFNILNAYQKDFELGKNRDSAYVYGPMRPRTYYFGIRLKSL